MSLEASVDIESTDSPGRNFNIWEVSFERSPDGIKELKSFLQQHFQIEARDLIATNYHKPKNQKSRIYPDRNVDDISNNIGNVPFLIPKHIDSRSLRHIPVVYSYGDEPYVFSEDFVSEYLVALNHLDPHILDIRNRLKVVTSP